MAARFQCHIERCSCCRFLKRRNSITLCMRLSAASVIPFSYDPPVFYDDRSYHRIGTRPSDTMLRKLYRTAHVIPVCHVHSFFLLIYFNPYRTCHVCCLPFTVKTNDVMHTCLTLTHGQSQRYKSCMFSCRLQE